jgi:signal transduction histidine kinase
VGYGRHVLRRPPADDVALAAVLLAIAATEIGLSTEPSDLSDPAAVAVALVVCAALAWRRRAPIASALVVLATLTAISALWQTSGLWIALAGVVATYSVAAYSPRVPAGIALGLWLFGSALSIAQEDNRTVWDFFANLVFAAIFMVVGPWVAGRVQRRRRREAAAIEQRAAEVERRAESAVIEERQRMARELHDVVGHALSVIVVQAGAERATLDSPSPSTHETLRTIERTGRSALAEMRRLLALMREDDEAVALAPQPSLEGLPALIENVRAAGLPVDMHTEGDPHALAPGVDLSAYRIVQEALTNALKHAGPARAHVAVRYRAADLELEITDDGAGGRGAEPGNGHGLVGMRQRVALHRGSLHTGARPDGGYAVKVRLPYELRS